MVICVIVAFLVRTLNLDTTFLSAKKAPYSRDDLWAILRQQQRQQRLRVSTEAWIRLKELAIHKPQRWSRGGKNHSKRKPSIVHGLQNSTTGTIILYQNL